MVREGRIRRILYSFNIARAFLPTRRFARKREEITPELLKSYVSAIWNSFFRKDTEAKKKAALVEYRAPFLKMAIMSVIITVLLIFGVVAFVLLTAKPPPPLQNVTPIVLAPPAVAVSINSSGILDSGSSAERFFSIIDFATSNLDTANASLLVFRDPLPDSVFILRTRYLHATKYDSFKESLQAKLSERGISIAEMTTDELLRLPNTSSIILIVPSGNLPALFLGMEDPQFDMMRFTQAGNVLIYIGYSPLDGVLRKDIPEPQIVSAEMVKQRFGIDFKPDDRKPEFLNFPRSLYTVASAHVEKVPVTVRAVPGAASVSWGGGTAFFISSTLDGWAPTPDSAAAIAASDIADVVSFGQWAERYAIGSISLNATNNSLQGRKVIFTQQVKISGSLITQAYARLIFQASKAYDNQIITTGKSIQLALPSKPRGRAINEVEVLSSALTDKLLDVRYSLNETGGDLRQLYFSIINSSGGEFNFTLMSPEPKPLRISDATYSFYNTLPSGEYILRITDADRNIFAQSYLRIPVIRIEPYIMAWDRGQFTFRVYLGDEIYLDRLKHIRVTFDGGFPFEAEAYQGSISYNITFEPGAGNHTFIFQAGGDNIPVVSQYVRGRTLWERPELVLLGIISLLLFGIGYIIRRPEAVTYTLDVPDFPPLQAIAIPIKRETLLNLFDAINKELKWTATPLSLQDLKAGFKRILYRGRPIIIGDYNLEHLLDQLKEEGYVESALDYYGLRAWEKQTGKSVHYLAMLRALRDLFVVEGIPFTPFGQRTDCDTTVNIGGERVFLHIYSDDRVIGRALSTAAEGRTVIVFEDEGIMKEFTGRIHSPASQNVMFKILLDNGKINITPIDKLIDVLNKRFTLFYYA